MNKFAVALSAILCCVSVYGQNEIVGGGIVVNYSPAASGKYIGSPSICVLPDGTYIAANDFFGPKSREKQGGAITEVFASEDRGITWHKTAKIEGQFWSTLFTIDNELYLLGTRSGHSDILIRKSVDNGKTWTKPENSKCGLLFQGEYHTAPVPVVIYNGRVWRAYENAASKTSDKWPEIYSAFVISAPLGSDLLDAANWRMSKCLPSSKPQLGRRFRGWLEGNVVYDVAKGSLVDILRVHSPFTDKEYAAILDINKKGTKLTFNPKKAFVKMPGGSKKFTVRYDVKSQRYWSLVNHTDDRFKDIQADRVRNTLALVSSPDLVHWYINEILIDHPDPIKHGFQYVDWQFDGDDIIYLVRTAYDDDKGGADNYHNANYLTFHRKENFRNVKTDILYE